MGPVDADTGMCCASGVVDRFSKCCESGTLDDCGMCDGDGVAVDVIGKCCTAPLPPSGFCCAAGVVDSCGVCGGDNQCT